MARSLLRASKVRRVLERWGGGWEIEDGLVFSNEGESRQWMEFL